MRYDKRAIMLKAWRTYRKGGADFPEALHRAWMGAKAEPVNAARIEAAKAAAGILEPVNTWAGWKAKGFTVKHGSKALFTVELIHSSKGDGKSYKAAFFGASQVEADAAA